MDAPTRQMLQAVDKRIANLQQIRSLIVAEFGEQGVVASNGDTPHRRSPGKKRHTRRLRAKNGASRKMQMHNWLKANGPAARKDIIAGTGFPSGTVGSLLSQGSDLFENKDGKWAAI